MGENLRTTKYNDGTEITIITEDTIWANNLDNGKKQLMMCWYKNELNNKNKYGGLYNWYAIDSASNGNKNVCPTDWHVASDEDWESLMKFVSKDQGVGEKQDDGDWTEIAKYLKSTKGWRDDGNGVDYYGFLGISSGLRLSSYFLYEYSNLNFWTTSFSEDLKGWSYLINFNDYQVSKYDYNKAAGFSIRCVKEKSENKKK